MILVVKTETLLVDHVSRNTSDVATAADATPVMTMYADADYAGQTGPITLTVAAVTGVTGAYAGTKDTTSLALGSYVVKVTYLLATADRLYTYRVRIV